MSASVCFCHEGKQILRYSNALIRFAAVLFIQQKCAKFGNSERKLYVYKSFYETKLGNAWMNFETAGNDLF
jgi:hypothetical protein